MAISRTGCIRHFFRESIVKLLYVKGSETCRLRMEKCRRLHRDCIESINWTIEEICHKMGSYKPNPRVRSHSKNAITTSFRHCKDMVLEVRRNVTRAGHSRVFNTVSIKELDTSRLEWDWRSDVTALNIENRDCRQKVDDISTCPMRRASDFESSDGRSDTSSPSRASKAMMWWKHYVFFSNDVTSLYGDDPFRR